MDGSDQEEYSNGDERDALENAQRTRLDTELELDEVGVREQRGTDEKPCCVLCAERPSKRIEHSIPRVQPVL